LNNLKRLIGSTQFHTFLAFAFLALFSWPLLTIPDGGGGLSSLKYILVSWMIMIILFACFDLSDRKKDDG